MKTGYTLFMRIVSLVIVSVMVMVSSTCVTFAEGQIDGITEKESLADVLSLGDDESVEVIVKFTAPSLLELNTQLDSSYALSYEQRLLSKQNAILNQLGLVPQFRYTGVINAVALTATADEIRLLEQMSGVEGVYLSQSIHVLGEHLYYENAISSSDMMGINTSISSEYTGDGVLVAILDSGITLEHEAFNNTKYVQNPALTSEDVINLGFGSSAGYYNEKIPFYCDYTGSTSDFADVEGHGSHVAGIIGGYAENEDGTVKFSGIAPGAQICAMRVLNEYGGGNDSMIIAALEDAYKLGVDIINISLGRTSAFRLGGDQFIAYNGIYENLEKAGVMVVCSAGNLGSMAENTPRHVLDENCVDYGTLSLPAIYPGNIGVGSIDNPWIYTAVVNIGGQNYMYSDNAESDDPLNFKNTFSGKAVDIAYFDNYGKAEDYIGVDVTGKIVAVKRGELSFTDKCKYATDAGAVGLIVINGASDAMGGMIINDQSIPAILVGYGAAQHLPMTDGIITFGYTMVEASDSVALSYFSSVGVTPDLEIGLDILGVGRYVNSVKAQTTDEYISYSGTSMAAPTVAGTYALFYQMLKEDGESRERTRADIANYLEDVTQSTATLLTDDAGNLYSPRFQGAGFIDLDKAVAAETYISTPLVCLGYDKSANGHISVEYELVNVGNEDRNYTAKVSAITDSFRQITPTDYKNNVTPQMLPSYLYTYVIYVNGTSVAPDEEITLPASDSITVKLELKLSDAANSTLSSAFPYGYFLDGFVEFYDVTAPSEAAMHGGYVSFVGDWLAAPALEPLTQADVMDWIHSIGADIDEMLPYFAAGHINANYSYASLLVGDEAYYIGENPLAEGTYIPSFAERNAISAPVSNADKVIYDSLYLCPSLLRSCKSIRYVVTNSETGEVYATESQRYIIKDIPYGDYQHMGMSYFVFEPVYTAPNELGQMAEQYIPTGTEVTISIYTLLDHPDATERLEAEYAITVDYTAPILNYEYDASTRTLTVRCSDNEYLAGIVLEEADDSSDVKERVASRIYADETSGLEYTEVFDLSDYDGNNIKITVSDYASNMVTEVLSLANGNASNIESVFTVGNELSVQFADTPYLYQEVAFTVAPAEGYCFTDAFAVLVNGKELVPVSVENGIYSYRTTLTQTEFAITSVGTTPHIFVPTVTKEATCPSSGEISHICSNCSYIGDIEVIPSSSHTGGTAETLVKATCTKAGVTAVSCTKCGVVLTTQSVAALGHTKGELVNAKEATCFAEGYTGDLQCATCGMVIETGRVIEKCPHSWDNNCDEACNTEGCNHTRTITHIPNEDDGDCTTAITCSVCGKILTDVQSHTFDNDCDTDCNNCSFTRAIEHTYDDKYDKICNVCNSERDTPCAPAIIIAIIVCVLVLGGVVFTLWWSFKRKRNKG